MKRVEEVAQGYLKERDTLDTKYKEMQRLVEKTETDVKMMREHMQARTLFPCP
jgi:hypothetical protein